MSETNHTPHPPEPATPILASHLLELEERQRARFTREGKSERLSTACTDIDSLLGGNGIERGVVVGISAAEGEGRLISLNILASILLSRLPTSTPTIRATIIDTTGSFPLALLAKLLKSRIIASGTFPEAEVDTNVQKCLEMIGISRVFDLEGLWEVLGEMERAPDDISNHPRETERQISDPGGVEIIIIDTLTHIINELFSRKEKSDAHILLSLLSTSLTTLSATSNILTLLHNTLVPSHPTPNPNPNLRTTQAPPTLNYYPQPKQPKPQAQSSTLFPSNPSKPALGQIFSQFPSLHLFLSKLPKTREDAEMLYAGGGSGGSNERKVGHCIVIEVLKDECPNLGTGKEERWFGFREGEWCCVDVDVDGIGFRGAFVEEGAQSSNLKGKEKEMVHGAGRGEFGGGVGTVSSVAKVWGFGGRRV